MMTLTDKQQQGLDLAINRYRNGEKYTVIGGYAGTGKSTLVKFIISALANFGIDPDEDVCYAAFTGKAAQVLLSKGNKNVMTLHKLLYDSIPMPNGRFFRRPKIVLDYKVVIVDEVSMAPAKLMELLLRHRVHVICLGDPFQLPPIREDDDNHLLDNPHIFLDEIMRQAEESEIIRLSMKIRSKEPISLYDGNEVKILSAGDLNTGMMSWADQILVATNATRMSINNQMRDLLGHQGGPQEGDKVICLRNYWDNIADNEDPLVNGTIGYISDVYDTFMQYPKYLSGKRVDITAAKFKSDTGADFGELQMDKNIILTGNSPLDWKEKYKIDKTEKYRDTIPYEFAYGYAVTYWKAQGSEWDNVLVLEEGFPFGKIEHLRAMYTAVTRASKKLVLIKK